MAESKRICVLISGGGTTLKNLIDVQSRGELHGRIAHVISSNDTARGIEYARSAAIDVDVFSHREHAAAEAMSQKVFDACRQQQIDLVVCGGFLRRLVIPADFENRVINIHPSLIPAFCGKGYYGMKVHQAVLDYGCKLSGCTVHFVDNEFDHGPIIAQQSIPVLADDTPASLQARVFEQECKIYPQTINWICDGRVSVDGRRVRIAGQP